MYAVGEVCALIGVDQTEVIPAAQEIALVLKSRSDTPGNIQPLEGVLVVLRRISVHAVAAGVDDFFGRQVRIRVNGHVACVFAPVQRQTALDGRTRIKHQVGLFRYLELILPIDEELHLAIGDHRAVLGVVVVRIAFPPSAVGDAEGIVDTDRAAEACYITGIIDQTGLEAVQGDMVAQTVFRTRVIDAQCRSRPAQLDAQTLFRQIYCPCTNRTNRTQ